MAFSSTSTVLQIGIVGQLAYSADNNMVVESMALIDTVDIPPGRGVTFDAANSSATVNACHLPAGAGEKFLGLAYDDGNLPIEEAGYDAATYNRVPVLMRGVGWALTSEAVDPTDAVYFQHTTNGLKLVGSFRTDNDGGNAELLTGCRYAGTYSSGKAAIYFNQP